MKTKLYTKYGKETAYQGEFRDKAAAEKYFHSIQAQLRCKLGIIVSPIYVQTGKGRGK